MSLQLETKDKALFDAVVADWKSAPITDRERTLLTWTEKLTLHPARMTADDLAPLRAVGLSDKGLLDLAQLVSYFNYINRMADGLGVDLEDFMPPHPGAAGSES